MRVKPRAARVAPGPDNKLVQHGHDSSVSQTSVDYFNSLAYPVMHEPSIGDDNNSWTVKFVIRHPSEMIASFKTCTS